MKDLIYILLAFVLIKKLSSKRNMETEKTATDSKKKTSQNGIEKIIFEEGKRRKAYKDTKGFWTIGVGHLIQLPSEAYLLSKELTDKEISDLLVSDLATAERAVNRLGVKLTQNQFDSLVSIAFNVGGGNFNRSELASELKKGNFVLASELIVKNGENKARRTREQSLFLA